MFNGMPMDDTAVGIEPYIEDDAIVRDTLGDGRPRIRIYRLPYVAAVLGRGSDPENEIHLDACREDGFALLRRRGGGCSVLLDPGNVIVSASVPVSGIGMNKAHFEVFTHWIIDGLTRLGMSGVGLRGISDFAVKDRKVGGACIYRTRGLLLYSATLLVEPEIRRLSRYLKHPPREPDYRRGRAHEQFVQPLAELFSNTGGAADLAENLRRRLPTAPPLE